MNDFVPYFSVTKEGVLGDERLLKATESSTKSRSVGDDCDTGECGTRSRSCLVSFIVHIVLIFLIIARAGFSLSAVACFQYWQFTSDWS